jgi:hypothetical protein
MSRPVKKKNKERCSKVGNNETAHWKVQRIDPIGKEHMDPDSLASRIETLVNVVTDSQC